MRGVLCVDPLCINKYPNLTISATVACIPYLCVFFKLISISFLCSLKQIEPIQQLSWNASFKVATGYSLKLEKNQSLLGLS